MITLAGILFLAAVSTVLWLSYEFAAAYHMFSLSLVPPVMHVAAAVSTAALIVIIIAQFLLRFGFPRLLRADPTSLQRGLVFAALSFIAAAVALAHLGFDLTTILTTSAVVTAIVGFSIQPTLGSLFSGLVLDRVVRVGDGVLINDEDIEITSLNWRSVAGRRGDGGTVILPNAQLAGATLIVLPQDQPALAGVLVKVPAEVPPDRIRGLITSIVSDFPEVDTRRPVGLKPDKESKGKSNARYRASFWVQRYKQRGRIEASVRSRIWYVFRRENVFAAGAPPDTHGEAELLPMVAAALRQAAAQQSSLPALDRSAKDVLQSGEVLRYGDGERIILPMRFTGRYSCLLVGGSIAQIDRASDAPMTARPGREAMLALIEQALALRIGPYAEFATRQAAATRASVSEICEIAAQEIDDPQARQDFIQQVVVPRDVIVEPGFVLEVPETKREADGGCLLRAVGHALILVAPAGSLFGDGPRKSDVSESPRSRARASAGKTGARSGPAGVGERS